MKFLKNILALTAAASIATAAMAQEEKTLADYDWVSFGYSGGSTMSDETIKYFRTVVPYASGDQPQGTIFFDYDNTWELKAQYEPGNYEYIVEYVDHVYTISMNTVMLLNGGPYTQISSLDCSIRVKTLCWFKNVEDFNVKGKFAEAIADIVINNRDGRVAHAISVETKSDKTNVTYKTPEGPVLACIKDLNDAAASQCIFTL